jgi:hypothetical protein
MAGQGLKKKEVWILRLFFFLLITAGCISSSSFTNSSTINHTIPANITIIPTTVTHNITIEQEIPNVLRFAGDRPLKNIRYTSTSSFPIGDLDFLEADGATFEVDHLAGKVRIARWEEGSSYRMREVISLDDGTRKAEAFARENDPEIWNFSTTTNGEISINKSITASQRALNQGIDRRFEYVWNEQYSVDTPRGSCTLEGANSVSIEINPNSGNIIEYFSKNRPLDPRLSLVVLLSEKEASIFAERFFAEHGVLNITETHKKAERLEIVGYRPDEGQHLAWVFTAKAAPKKMPIGGTLFIDANDGYIIDYLAVD